MKTVTVGVTTESFPKYLGEIDKLGLGYSLAATNLYASGKMEFELWVDGGDHNGTKLVLHPDGTWSATTEVVVSEE